MTEPLFFDTDCISAFLWVDDESILAKLFPGRIVIPKEVYDELSHPSVNRIKGLRFQVDSLINQGLAVVESIEICSNSYQLYKKLTISPDSGYKIIGRGEAASIVLAKEHDGILASNNLRDIEYYVKKYGLKHLTTGGIMKMAFDAGLIDEIQGNIIWSNMLARKRKLGYTSFSEYLEKNDGFNV